MSRYYFDLRDGEQFFIGEEGTEMPDLEAVQKEVAQSLAEMARHAVRLRNGRPDACKLLALFRPPSQRH